MRTFAQVISIVSLAGTALAPVLYLAGSVDLDAMKLALLVATVAWFVATPLWMGREPAGAAGDA